MRDQQQVCQTRVEELTRELSRLMSEINRHRKEHGNLADLKAKLQQVGESEFYTVSYLYPIFGNVVVKEEYNVPLLYFFNTKFQFVKF